ncbi:type II secretion system F family protein [Stenotrophomonas sp. SY1]|uniref:type II secretion system F family protein n=1 Tax=Stenotrophomonas sp. SY1 TaxID=477235 RepID=UPI001E52BC33|nr:type II secretion system F family protein [Stenotrophomonas sp. SY1]MCD9087416.1 type II secretion system F family protein [Stenotrophomonas sp. SY1]
MLPLLLGSSALLLVAIAMGLWWGLATRAQQRAAAEHAETRLSNTSPQGAADPAAAQRKPVRRWAELLRRASLPESPRTLVLLALPGVLAAVGTSMRMNSVLFGLFVLALYLLGAGLWLHRRIEKTQQRLISQMPDFLENMVRMAGIGNSLSMAFQSATQNVDPPLRPILDNALSYTRAGMDLDRALQHAAQAYRLRPLEMLAVILGTSIRIGGRSDQILQRMSDFMRDLEEVQRELQATTSETRMSAWVLGSLPVLAALFMALLSPDFFQPMLHDPLGRKIMLIAILLEGVGAFALYRLAKSL